MTDATGTIETPEQPQPGTVVAVRDYLQADLDGRWRYLSNLVRAGNMLPDAVRDPGGREYLAGRAFLLAETGAMLGIHPIAAINGIHVIEGKPTISPALMSAVIRAAGHKLRVQTTGTVEEGDFKATATLTRADDLEFTYSASWTPQRAVRAELLDSYQRDEVTGIWMARKTTSGGKVSGWAKFTEAYCKARAISEVGREGAEDVLMGMHYTPEELGATTDEGGEVIVLHEDGRETTPEKPEPAKRTRKTATNGAQGTRRKPPTAPVVTQEEGTTGEDLPGTPPAEDGTNPEAEAPPAAEDVVDAEVVEDSGPAAVLPTDPNAPNAPHVDNRKPADLKAARNADAREGETETDYQWRKARERQDAEQAARDAEAEDAAERARLAAEQDAKYADEATGVVPGDVLPPQYEETGEEVAARIKAEREARGAQTRSPQQVRADAEAELAQPEPWDTAATFESEPSELDRIKAIGDLKELRNVWDATSANGTMTTESRLAILKRKAELEKAPAEPAAPEQTQLPGV